MSEDKTSDAVTILKKRYGVTEERLDEARNELSREDLDALLNQPVRTWRNRLSTLIVNDLSDSQIESWQIEDATIVSDLSPRVLEALKVAVRTLSEIKEIQEALGGESVLLDDVNATLADILSILRGEK